MLYDEGALYNTLNVDNLTELKLLSCGTSRGLFAATDLIPGDVVPIMRANSR